jgi:hypothetical protein
VLGGVSGSVLVAVAGNQVELPGQVVRAGALVPVSVTDDRGVLVRADLVTRSVGKEEVSGVVGPAKPVGTVTLAIAATPTRIERFI